MADTLANKGNLAVVGPSLGMKDINKIPRMQNASSDALANAAPRGVLRVTQVNMSNFDAAVDFCSKITNFAEIKSMNQAKGVTSTETSCGWLATAGGGVGILGNHSRPIGPIPTGITPTHYFSPVLTTSKKTLEQNKPNAILCVASASGFTCVGGTDAFTNPIGSGKYASVDDEFTTPFLDQLPMKALTPLTRDSYIQTDMNAGTMVATLYQESNKGLTNPSLETRSSYSIFNKNMVNPSGVDTESWETSFKSYQPVGNDMYPRPSRDITVTYGNLEQHDFCAEINPQTIINEDNISCLQKDWIKKGGSTHDYNFPTTALYGTCYGRIQKH